MSKEVKHSSILMKRKVYLSQAILIIFLIFYASETCLATLTMPAEDQWGLSEKTLEDFDQKLSISDRYTLTHTSKNQKNALPPHLRTLFERRQEIVLEKNSWLQVVQLKKSILNLPSDHLLENHEADLIAQTTIQTFQETKKKFNMIRPAALNNIFVNMKLKNDGLCWHWARELMKKLEKLSLKTLEFHWITAHQDKLSEHNAIAIYSQGKTFHEGLVLDGWRNAGTPYWGPVAKDHYPWEAGSFFEDDSNEKNQNDQSLK
ncbi:MAG: hypothetical protein IPJ69_07340 [Deltaproteobacteria bacterium]|nr:MAG: hypothetical protein IPJ69_07340 [Deltaproteobacteria bacterium]